MPTALLVLADGTVFAGFGTGATGEALGEVCFNTAMTGYQEVLTDPSYSDQLLCFTFPHLGITGTNADDTEDESARQDGPPSGAKGVIMRAAPGEAASWRSDNDFDTWLNTRGIVGIYGVDTRALTVHIRRHGMPHGVIAHHTDGQFDIPALQAMAKGWAGLENADLAAKVSAKTSYPARQSEWDLKSGYAAPAQEGPLVVVIDYGAKSNIVRRLAALGLRVTVVPCTMTAADILALHPDGVLLSNGPGDPAATAAHASPVIQSLISANVPIFGICLGHQLLALALGANTKKMDQGHHGANHPVKDLSTGKVEIVSMNHGFTVDEDTLPDGVVATHISLFDGSNCGLRLKEKPVFSVQYHPEASPGPQDSFYLFDDFKAALGRTAPQ
ncbi:MAG: glutamine-hydrolyzing carbamoyl-phosphate synthase small subunit [Robiginitomaculum sp.]|nr:glutamine-hydrolyzing carbamoyl-phosphate synthase small subunit [Robiginitomaculum sp.]